MKPECVRQKREGEKFRDDKFIKMYLKIKTYPDSKKPRIIKKAEDSFDVYVKEKAERGLANKAVAAALAAYFKVPTGKVRLIKGARSKNKIFEIDL